MEDRSLEKPAVTPTPVLTIHTIPMEFYGGKNPAPPEIQNAKSAAPTSSADVAAAKPKIAPKPVAALPAVAKAAGAAAPKPKWFLPVAIGGAVIILLGGGGLIWWFFGRTTATPTPVPVPIVIPTATTTIVIPTEVATSTIEVATSTLATPVSLITPHSFLDSSDSDGDGLTDVEEELWGTNPANADTDNDIYSDQTELLNLYNPVGVAPQKIIDTQFVKTFINSQNNYSVYYPSGWIARALDETTNKEVLFTAITGEYVNVHTVPYPTTESFPQWFAANLPGEVLSIYQPFKNKFGVSGIMSPDKLVALISDGNNLFILNYNGGTRIDINYRTSFRVIVQSFKFTGAVNPIDIGATVNNISTTSTPVLSSATSTITSGEMAISTPSSSTPLLNSTSTPSSNSVSTSTIQKTSPTSTKP